jgi:hypothetical protein
MGVFPRMESLKFWFLLALVAVVCLVAWYVAPRRPKEGGDILDAVVAVQRRCTLIAIAEPAPNTTDWVTEGGIYLSRDYKTPQELDRLDKYPQLYDNRWDGVLYFKARGARRDTHLPFLPAPADRALDYGDFAVYGDPELLKDARRILAEAGFEETP